MADTINSALQASLLSATAQSGSTVKTATDDKTLNKDMFLKLMVAQLQNQSPLNPVEGTAFLQQLSQISGVEQMVEMRRQLESIHQLLEANAANTQTQTAGTSGT